MQAHNVKVANAQKVWQDAKIKAIDELTKKISTASTKLNDAKSVYTTNMETNTKNKVSLAEVTINFNNKIKEWNDANEKEFNYKHSADMPLPSSLVPLIWALTPVEGMLSVPWLA